MTRKEIIEDFKQLFGSEGDYINHVRSVGRTTVRCEFCDHLDYLQKDGQITERQRCNTVASDKELFEVKVRL